MNLDRVRELADCYEQAIREVVADEPHNDERLALEGFAMILAGAKVMAYPKGREIAKAALRDLTEPIS